jgi:hypothetical protein
MDNELVFVDLAEFGQGLWEGYAFGQQSIAGLVLEMLDSVAQILQRCWAQQFGVPIDLG